MDCGVTANRPLNRKLSQLRTQEPEAERLRRRLMVLSLGDVGGCLTLLFEGGTTCEAMT